MHDFMLPDTLRVASATTRRVQSLSSPEGRPQATSTREVAEIPPRLIASGEWHVSGRINFAMTPVSRLALSIFVTQQQAVGRYERGT